MIERLKRNEKAVSPVIGVILMVAITVILAAVIASFVFGMGAKAPKTAPQAQLALSDAMDTLDNDNNSVFTISHQGGDALTCGNMKIYIYDTNDQLLDTLSYSGGYFSGDNFNSTPSLDERFDPGEIITIREEGTNVNQGDMLKVKVIDTLSNQPILDGQVQVW